MSWWGFEFVDADKCFGAGLREGRPRPFLLPGAGLPYVHVRVNGGWAVSMLARLGC